MAGDEERFSRERPANDNRSPEGLYEQSLKQPDPKSKAVASERLDKVVLSIARLIGRRMAREDFNASQPANDNESSAGVGRMTSVRRTETDKEDDV
ncbi:hypothetical protein D5400_20165 [Georhizobium profundi]|jgi:hypothetical protein|uniref:Uncharacterized protein n=1 Tax=Georhizobium profundi TaxID=2341112 RepID=A0A3Q8XRF4_9HYPH|nr:hypothetical protein [Georhizobium profundi]AZN73297.1 hypothetical protein D5400_20165 [Georhizobium profundi]